MAEELVKKCVKVLVSHDLEIKSLQQQLELDFLVRSEVTKQKVQAAIAAGPPQGKAVRAF